MTIQSRVAEVKARDAVVAVGGVACMNASNTRVLVTNDGQYTCACVIVARKRQVWCCSYRAALKTNDTAQYNDVI